MPIRKGEHHVRPYGEGGKARTFFSACNAVRGNGFPTPIFQGQSFLGLGLRRVTKARIMVWVLQEDESTGLKSGNRVSGHLLLELCGTFEADKKVNDFPDLIFRNSRRTTELPG